MRPPVPDSRRPDYRNPSLSQQPQPREALPSRPLYDDRQAPFERVPQPSYQRPLTQQAPAAGPAPPPAQRPYRPPPPSPAYQDYVPVAKAKTLQGRARL